MEIEKKPTLLFPLLFFFFFVCLMLRAISSASGPLLYVEMMFASFCRMGLWRDFYKKKTLSSK